MAGFARPVRTSSLPGLILVAGADPADRDPLLPQARALAAHGIFTLTYDKRADGYTWRTRDFQAVADDAVGVAPLAVVTRPMRFACLILVSAPIVSPLEQASWMVDRRIEALPQFVHRTSANVMASARHVVDYLDFDVAPARRTTGTDR
jgi:hypothetical protein